MINQFGVKGFNLVNGAFEFYEITLNGQYKGTVKKSEYWFGWMWTTDRSEVSGFECEHSAIVALKKHLTEIAK